MSSYLQSHRSHDVAFILERWNQLAETAGLTRTSLMKVDDFEVVAFTSRTAIQKGRYLSAGVHGDEVAGVSGLLEWAEENVPFLQSAPLWICPLFNPWGVHENRRQDHLERDLNRIFHSSEPPVGAWKQWLGDAHFDRGLMLHEDYDAQGIYVYELTRCENIRCGTTLLDSVSEILPIEHRVEIDGAETDGSGVLTRDDAGLREMSEALPEAVYLHLDGICDHSVTFETPSEASLECRVRAHKRMIESFIQPT